MTVRVIEASVQEFKECKELAEVHRICVCDHIIRLTEIRVIKNVTIDSDIGRNTVFTIGSEDFGKISVCIYSPNGHKYDSTSTEFNKNENLKRIQFKPKVTEPGVWSISLIKHSKQTICVSVSVKTQPFNPNPIQMRVSFKEADSNSPPIIITEIRKGSEAVIGAEVTATVDKPDGTQNKLKLINYNNIYCNFFTDYCGGGRYNVTVLAQNKGSNCQLMSLSSRTIGKQLLFFVKNS